MARLEPWLEIDGFLESGVAIGVVDAGDHVISADENFVGHLAPLRHQLLVLLLF